MTAPAKPRFRFGAGVSRKAHAELCRSCGAVILVGLDHDTCAINARVEPFPLNAKGEATALMMGRPTFELRWIGGEYVLDYRMAEHITGRPAGDPRIEVMAAHECGATYGEELRTMRATEKPRTQTHTQTPDNDEPPF